METEAIDQTTDRKRMGGCVVTPFQPCSPLREKRTWTINHRTESMLGNQQEVKARIPLERTNRHAFASTRAHTPPFSQLSQTCGCLGQHSENHHQRQRTINGGQFGMRVTEKWSDLRMKQRARGVEDAQGWRHDNCSLLQLQETIIGRWTQYNGHPFAERCFEEGHGKILRLSDMCKKPKYTKYLHGQIRLLVSEKKTAFDCGSRELTRFLFSM